jgi:hypothetical protein
MKNFVWTPFTWQKSILRTMDVCRIILDAIRKFVLMWTSLGLKFVVQIAQLIDRAFAVSVAGANVKAREITSGESPC